MTGQKIVGAPNLAGQKTNRSSVGVSPPHRSPGIKPTVCSITIVHSLALGAMLGKRVRQLPADPNASAEKRLRSNMIDLLSTGQVSAPRLAALMNDAYGAGVKECYSAPCQALCTKPEVLFNDFLKGTEWPALHKFDIPL
eukprot:3796251-Amphidinium_carterae.1